MTCPRCRGLGLISTCILGPHCSCPDGAACGNATSKPCQCQLSEDEIVEMATRDFDRVFGAAIECAATAKEMVK
jgi:hypothetical protein